MCRNDAPVVGVIVVFVVENDLVTHIGVTTAPLQAVVLTCLSQRTGLHSVVIVSITDSTHSGSNDLTYAGLTSRLIYSFSMGSRTLLKKCIKQSEPNGNTFVSCHFLSIFYVFLIKF